MSNCKFPISLKLVSLFIFLSLLSLTSEAAPTYASHDCSNSSFFTRNSTYQANLNIVLSALYSNSTRQDGFYKTAVGQNPPDVVTGLLLCRGDLTPTACQDCISNATKDILNRCPLDKVALIWYDECTLRFSNETDLNNLVPFVNMFTTNQNIVAAELDRFNGLLASTMKSLAQTAANSQTNKKFDTAVVKFTSSLTLYSLVQCSPELAVSGCLTVLESAIASLPACCSGKQGGKVLLPSSNIRYELYPFFNYTASSPPLPLPPVMGSELGRPGKREILVLALASEVDDEEHDEEGNADDLHGEGFRTNRFLFLVRFGFRIGGSGIVGKVKVGVRIWVWIRIRVGIWRSETGGFGIGLSEWRGEGRGIRIRVRVRTRGLQNRSLRSGNRRERERGGKGRGRRRGWKGEKGRKGKSSLTIIAIAVPISVAMVLFAVGVCFLVRRTSKKYNTLLEENAGMEISTVESLQFDLGTIEAATNKFSDDNKIGKGGFGTVYKGTLSNGQEIAVKRLSKSSVQGAVEFKNEVVLVAKLQHRNLVRLLGFCLEGEEKILVYEYVPNRSLDYFLFESERQGQLDWSSRYNIIGGIARGILYLHEDSRLRIIHRDLKASNVFGYMSPEYAMHGRFSVKSDVFSFGVLILEIISGKKNNCFYQSEHDEDLLSYAWKQWKNGTPSELLDPTIRGSFSKNEVIRCIHIGLLCVQEDPANRPTMATVVLMLDSYSVSLQLPQQPAFLLRSRATRNTPTKELQDDSFTSQTVPLSTDEAPITELYPR
uniref:Cysteine-rich receptor-like protein kinase 10 n=1 Tax=Fagus sylvatica TaxID=28930 RepID=A0A2N9IYK4_FAGSY